MEETVKKTLEKIFLDNDLMNEFLNLGEEQIYEFCLKNSEKPFTEAELKKYGLDFFKELYSKGDSKTKISKEDLKNFSGGVKKIVSVLVAILSMCSASISTNAYDEFSSSKGKINLSDKTKKVLKNVGIGASGAFLSGAVLGTIICGTYKLYDCFSDKNNEVIFLDDKDMKFSGINSNLCQKDNQLMHLKGLPPIKSNFANEFNSSFSSDNNKQSATFKHKNKGYTIEVQTDSDIINCPCDVLVNAANEQCLGGSGVDLAFGNAGGKKLYKQRENLSIVEGTRNVRCRTGNLRVTGTGDISKYNVWAKCVFHAVGPMDRDENRQQKLYSAYYNCLDVACTLGYESIAFPSISTGEYAYPADEAAEIAINAVVDFFNDHSNVTLKRVKWCLCAGSNKNYNYYTRPLMQPKDQNNGNVNNSVIQPTQDDEKKTI